MAFSILDPSRLVVGGCETAGVRGRGAHACLRGRAPWIGARDAADLAVAAHMSLDRYPQGAVSYPDGVEFLSHAEVAERITDEIGTAVQYVPVSREQWQADLESSAPASGGVINPCYGATYFEHRSQVRRTRRNTNRPANPQVLAEAIGHQPLSLTEFIRSNREQFLRHRP